MKKNNRIIKWLLGLLGLLGILRLLGLPLHQGTPEAHTVSNPLRFAAVVLSPPWRDGVLVHRKAIEADEHHELLEELNFRRQQKDVPVKVFMYVSTFAGRDEIVV